MVATAERWPRFISIKEGHKEILVTASSKMPHIFHYVCLYKLKSLKIPKGNQNPYIEVEQTRPKEI